MRALIQYHLLETLSGKPVGKGLVAKPKNKMQSIGNLNLCFSFIASEKIRLENIGPEDIWDGTEVCVMGLIWTLILRYQISHGGASSDSGTFIFEQQREDACASSSTFALDLSCCM